METSKLFILLIIVKHIILIFFVLLYMLQVKELQGVTAWCPLLTCSIICYTANEWSHTNYLDLDLLIFM